MLRAGESADLRAGYRTGRHRGPERLFAERCFVVDGKRRASRAQRVHGHGRQFNIGGCEVACL